MEVIDIVAMTVGYVAIAVLIAFGLLVVIALIEDRAKHYKEIRQREFEEIRKAQRSTDIDLGEIWSTLSELEERLGHVEDLNNMHAEVPGHE